MKILYLQSGGPTSVINSSFLGVIEAFQKEDKIETLYGSKFGLNGLLNLDYYTISKTKDYKKIASNCGAILGSARLKLSEDFSDETYKIILENTLKLDLDYILCNGGNDSMDTASKLNEFFKFKGIKTRTLGIPKTIDNDLFGTDRCPGFGSAAKYINRTIEDVSLDLNSYKKGRVTIIEVMGRDAGWLALSSSLSNDVNLGPDLIYIPEIAFDKKEFLEDVKSIFEKKSRVLVVISEALSDKDGNFISSEEDNVDAFGHKQLGSVSKALCDLVKKELGYNTRAIELNLMQRASTLLQSKGDLKEAYEVGYEAVKKAVEGVYGMMLSIKAINENEHKISLTKLEEVKNVVRHVPREYMNERGNYISEKGYEYLKFLRKDMAHIEAQNKLFEN